MKIVSLQAENLKRLVAVEIRPDGNLVEITGKNGQGKTSVLDAIWWALTGAEHIQAAPIRKGETEARIRLDLGEIIVTRTFRRRAADGETTTSIIVEGANGARFPSPQKMLDSLLGELCFDPLEFARMKPKDQFNALRKFVPGIDFDGIANLNRGDFEKRTDLNRFAKQERAAAAALIVPPDTPEESIDEQALVAELTSAGEQNADIEGRKVRRQQATEAILQLRVRATTASEGLRAHWDLIRLRHSARADELRDEIADLEERLKDARTRLANTDRQLEADLDAKQSEVQASAQKLTEEADGLQQRLNDAGELPQPVDTGALRAKIDAARQVNTAVTRLQQRRKHEVRADNAEKQAQALTESIDARNCAKQAAIAAAEMPVAGIGFGEDQVLLNGVPFEQGSDAEQLRASVAIAMAMNPKLRVVRVRDGSLLDEGSMQIISQMCDQHDCQCWVEVVDSSGKVGFVISDGHVVSTPAQREKASAAN